MRAAFELMFAILGTKSTSLCDYWSMILFNKKLSLNVWNN